MQPLQKQLVLLQPQHPANNECMEKYVSKPTAFLEQFRWARIFLLPH